MQLVSLRLPEKLLNRLDKRARKLRYNRSQLVRKLLEEALDDTPDERDGQFEKLRTELLMAVGQVGASVKEIPRFIRAAAEPNQDKSGPEERSPTKPQVVENPIVREGVSDTETSQTADGISPNQSADEKWSYASGAQAAPLRPRMDAIHDPSETMTIEAEVVHSSSDGTTSAADPHGRNVTPKTIEAPKNGSDRRAPRGNNQLDGLAIGDERRQSIRLARVLVFKGWDAKMLSDRFKLPLEQIENALAGQGDLASLKVEALLATWEDEMLVGGWNVPTV